MVAKPLLYRLVRQKLLKAGFTEINQKGSHVKFGKQTLQGYRVVIVPAHKEVAAGTLRSMLRQAGLTQKEFDDL